MPGYNFPCNDGDVIQATVCCYNGNQIGLNIGYWVTQASGGPMGINTVAPAIDTAMAGHYKLWLSADSNYYGSRFRNMNNLTFAPWIENTHSGVGLVTGLCAGSQLSGLITRTSASIGRSGRGRIFVPFVAESSVIDAQHISSGAVTALNAIGGDWQGGWAGTGGVFVPCIYQRPSTITTYTTGYISRNRIATQRRRGAYGRPNTIPPF
jgi:hypothetical protein